MTGWTFRQQANGNIPIRQLCIVQLEQLKYAGSSERSSEVVSLEAKTKPAAPTQDAHGLSAVEEAKARSHIADAAERQRIARGTIEYVSVPRLRRLGQRLHLIWIWIAQVVGAVWRRIADSHKWPGRWYSRVKLWRPRRDWRNSPRRSRGGLAAATLCRVPQKPSLGTPRARLL